ncbi:hypothetical protein Q669_27905 [Labrenzia sp. C1B10]|uniref:GntR family transcriptional regulator n=1 Tax=unclassified Labrenzia TaxID=2648686 RepID=UPI0003B8FB1A|nr:MULTISPECIES: GntR family transcriptional regulator [unclassified Labrenzia]ERP96685.1 hypothetical protein Q669_27905 [Labrenzia sp. C1B10]ERS03542.1 hypothetical protein Q675_31210 [Labrenzia sp. C1B70]
MGKKKIDRADEEATAKNFPHKSKSLSLDVYTRIREDILSASLAPNKKLLLREMSEQYGTSQGPIREALNRLVSEGMVVQNTQRGFTVASFGIVELEELVRTKQWLNELGLRESIKNGDLEWEEEILVAFHRLSRTPSYLSDVPLEVNRNPEWNRQHLVFHMSLINACNSEWLKGFCRTLFYASDRYRALMRQKGDPAKRVEEHRQIMEATIARDADRAVELLNRHFAFTGEMGLEKLNQFEKPA